MYVGFCTSPIAANTDDGGWQGLPALIDASTRTTHERALRLALPERRAQRAAEPHVPDARAPDRGRTHGGDAYLLTHPESADAAEAEADGSTSCSRSGTT